MWLKEPKVPPMERWPWNRKIWVHQICRKILENLEKSANLGEKTFHYLWTNLEQQQQIKKISSHLRKISISNIKKKHLLPLFCRSLDFFFATGAVLKTSMRSKANSLEASHSRASGFSAGVFHNCCWKSKKGRIPGT